MSVIDWRRCIKCGKHFDIGTNHSICPECRNQDKKQKRRKSGK